MGLPSSPNQQQNKNIHINHDIAFEEFLTEQES